MDVYAEIIKKIIKEQESIIGPVAIEQAADVPNLDVDWPKNSVSVKGDGAKVVNSLVDQYRGLFGQTSVEVCKDAAHSLLSKLPTQQVPSSLK